MDNQKFNKECIDKHLEHCGKWDSRSLVKFTTRDDLNVYYAKGAGAVCSAIKNQEIDFRKCTSAGRNVAVISNGTAVLGLGDIGTKAAMPVMEAKAVLMNQLAGLTATPIVINEKDPDKLIEMIVAMQDNFAAIHLEDIKAPECVYIETELQKRLDMPVYHDDQHGTAVAVLAALINTLKIIKKDKATLRVVVCGIGAAGQAIIKILNNFGIKNIIAVEKAGILKNNRQYNNPIWKEISQLTIGHTIIGDSLSDALKGSDVFIGVSAKNLVSAEMVNNMNDNPVVFAMANPFPEIDKVAIKDTKCQIYATGSSETINQINNVLVFPGMFKGLLEAKIKTITYPIFLAIAQAIASCVSQKELDNNVIVPNNISLEVVRKIVKVLVVKNAK